MTVYGHCREYANVNLTKPLILTKQPKPPILTN